MAHTYTVSYNPSVVAKHLDGTFSTATVTADQMVVNADGSVTFFADRNNISQGFVGIHILAAGSYVEVVEAS
jgi:hypothetical protein